MSATSSTTGHRPALVVGAGPVGLSVALALRARGVAPTVLEAQAADRPRPGSRAIFTHRATLEILERVRPGLGWEMAAAGLVWHTKRTRFRGRQVYARTYPPVPDGILPPLTSLPQTETERLLLAAAKSAGIEVVWQAPVTGVEATGDGVALRTGDGTRWTADYVVAADGPASTVRGAIGAHLPGQPCGDWFVIVDVGEDPTRPLPRERVFHYQHPAVGGRNVLHVPFAGGWRVDLQCRHDDDVDAVAGEAGLRAWLPRVMPDDAVDRLLWVSAYRFRQTVADRFADAHARVLLAGEAAHQFPPFGARGMNSGVADADAAAAAVQQARAAQVPAVARHAVERYAVERRDAALANRDAAGRALAHLQARDPATRTRRWAAAALSPVSTRAGKWLDSAPYGPALASSPHGGY